jgi:hypothetical protein
MKNKKKLHSMFGNTVLFFLLILIYSCGGTKAGNIYIKIR